MEIRWDKKKCRHAGICVKSLPEVFGVGDGQLMIDPSKAPKEEILRVIARCPSGALETID